MGPSPVINSGLKIGIVAGEASGDILGARLMDAIGEQAPGTRFVGVGGEQMLAAGLHALAPLDALAVNGFKDPLLRAPSLVRLLRRLRRRFVADGMDAVVGVDFNVFNLMLERRVRKRGIPTAHYVSPSVYFWRPGRVKSIARAADVVLALYPFEPALYAERGGRAEFVGHPLADEIGLTDGDDAARQRARETLDMDADRRVVALLPGSRRSEIGFLATPFFDAAAQVRDAFADPVFVVPAPSPTVYDAAAAALAAWRSRVARGAASRHADMDVRVVRGQSRTVIAAADIVLAKSGTATLETMLLRRPMVVAYRLGALTAWLVRRLAKSDFIALPNILAGRALVPELVQEDATPARLAAALIEQHRRFLADDDYQRTCRHWHEQLRGNSAQQAAAVVLSLIPGAAGDD